jgi:hypothetical protein
MSSTQDLKELFIKYMGWHTITSRPIYDYSTHTVKDVIHHLAYMVEREINKPKGQREIPNYSRNRRLMLAAGIIFVVATRSNRLRVRGFICDTYKNSKKKSWKSPAPNLTSWEDILYSIKGFEIHRIVEEENMYKINDVLPVQIKRVLIKFCVELYKKYYAGWSKAYELELNSPISQSNKTISRNRSRMKKVGLSYKKLKVLDEEINNLKDIEDFVNYNVGNKEDVERESRGLINRIINNTVHYGKNTKPKKNKATFKFKYVRADNDFDPNDFDLGNFF